MAKNAAYVADDALYADDTYEDELGSTFLTSGVGLSAPGAPISASSSPSAPPGARNQYMDTDETLTDANSQTIRTAPDAREIHGTYESDMPTNSKDLYRDVNPYAEDFAENGANGTTSSTNEGLYGGPHPFLHGNYGQETKTSGLGDEYPGQEDGFSKALTYNDQEDSTAGQQDHDAEENYSSLQTGTDRSRGLSTHGVSTLTAGGEVSQEDRLSLEQLIGQVEHMMRLYEQNAQYMDAERTRQHLENLRKRRNQFNRKELEASQQTDVHVFFEMVARHQENFDQVWARKLLEHKLRADDLIDALKWKHDDQQKELYHELRKKRIPKFSVELLNLRKRQVLLAKAQKYLLAEKIKRKADLLEAIEIDKIRRAAKLDNQLHFEALLKQQQWDRQMLASKLRLERTALLEAKAQDFQRLKNRLRNAEAELKKSHIRQMLIAERKLHPVYSTLQAPSTSHANESSLRSTGAAMVLAPTNHAKPSVRALASQGRNRN